MFGIGTQELLVILLLILLIFGAKKLPEIGGGLGRAIRNFRKACSEPDEIDMSHSQRSRNGDSRDEKSHESGQSDAK